MRFRKSASTEEVEEDPASSSAKDKRRGLRSFVKRVLRKNVSLDDVEPSGLPKTHIFLAESSNSSSSDAESTEVCCEPEQNGELIPGGILAHIVVEPERAFVPNPNKKEDDMENTDKRFPSPEIGDDRILDDLGDDGILDDPEDDGILDNLVVMPVGTQAQNNAKKVLPSDAEDSCGSVQDSGDEVSVDDSSYDDVMIPFQKQPRSQHSPEITIGEAASIDSTFYDPADDIVRDLHQAGTDFVSAFSRMFQSIFPVSANNVEDEKKPNETPKADKTFAEMLEECMTGALINCSSSNNKSCHPQHVDGTTIVQTDQLGLPPTQEEKAIVPSPSSPLFYLPQEPTETYQLEAQQGIAELAEATDGSSSSVESNGPNLEVYPVAENGCSSETGLDEEGDTLNITVLRQPDSFPAGMFSAFSQPTSATEKKEIGIARPVSVLSRKRSDKDDNDRILNERLRSVVSRNRSAQSPITEAEDVYRLPSDEGRGEDIILPPAFRHPADNACEEKRDSNVYEPPTIVLPPSLGQLASNMTEGDETVESNEFSLKRTAAQGLETVERDQVLFERTNSQASF